MPLGGQSLPAQRHNLPVRPIPGIFRQLDRPYTEEDYPDNEAGAGALLARAEQLVRDSCERHLILRLGPVFSFDGTNLINRCWGSWGAGCQPGDGQ